jgi:ABC-type maltose transport system permease subunit
MTSLFTRAETDPELCERYAQFASHMVRWQFKIIYWTMFFSNLFVLFLASWTYTRYVGIITPPPYPYHYPCLALTLFPFRGQISLERYSPGSAKRTKRLRQSIFLCLACVLVSTTIVIMEAYAILALQFCDGEDLISLYWSTWTMVQVGSLIAMVGIILALLHSLRNRRHP